MQRVYDLGFRVREPYHKRGSYAAYQEQHECAIKVRWCSQGGVRAFGIPADRRLRASIASIALVVDPLPQNCSKRATALDIACGCSYDGVLQSAQRWRGGAADGFCALTWSTRLSDLSIDSSNQADYPAASTLENMLLSWRHVHKRV